MVQDEELEKSLNDGLTRISNIVKWTTMVCGEDEPSEVTEEMITDFFEKISGGLFLCDLANALQLKSISTKHRSERASFCKRYYNLTIFKIFKSISFTFDNPNTRVHIYIVQYSFICYVTSNETH